MKKFTVRAHYKEFYHAVVEANDGDEANQKAIMKMEQDDFMESGDGEWWIDDQEPAEEIIPGHWEADPDYPVSDWQDEVARDDTRQSYREWVESCKALLDPIQP